MNWLVWYIPLGLLALLVWVMLLRRAYKVSPWFFVYAVFGLVSDTMRFLTHNHPHLYFATYWLTETGYCLLGILALYEVLRSTLRKLPRAWWVPLIFPFALLASVGLSLARVNAGTPRLAGLLFWIVTGEIAVRLVQVSIFAGLATLVPLIGLSWRQHSFGVAMGFGFFATVELLNTARFVDMGAALKFTWGVISIAAYSVALLIWIWYFWKPAKVADPELPILRPALR